MDLLVSAYREAPMPGLRIGRYLHFYWPDIPSGFRLTIGKHPQFDLLRESGLSSGKVKSANAGGCA